MDFVVQCDGCEYTIIANRFIDEYMPSANDAQIKIYLYLLRHPGNVSIADLEDRFNHTERDIIRALEYWQNLGLIALECDDSGAIVSVKLMSIPKQAAGEVHFKHPESDTGALSASDLAAFIDVPSDGTCMSNAQLMCIIETYLHRPITQSEAMTVVRISQDLHLPNDVIDYLVQFCIEHPKKGKKISFSYIESTAKRWAEAQVSTVAQARVMAARSDSDVKSIMIELGRTDAAAPAELDFIDRWRVEWQMPTDVILEACRQGSANAVAGGRLKYVNKILKSWHEAGVSSLADVEAYEAKHREEVASKPTLAPGKQAAARVRTSASNSQFAQFSQRQYTLEELEDRFIINK